MQDLIILGTGGHSVEMAYIVERINRYEPTWNLLGHIATGEDKSPIYGDKPVLGTIERLADYPDTALIAEFAYPVPDEISRQRLVNLIDPSTWVHPSARMAKGCVIYPNCFIGVHAKLGDRVFALSNTIINHDAVIGNHTTFASGATLAGGVTVEDDCYIGQSSAVRQFLRIGRNSLIGMGAVVIADVEPGSVMVGNPARRLRGQ